MDVGGRAVSGTTAEGAYEKSTHRRPEQMRGITSRYLTSFDMTVGCRYDIELEVQEC